MTRVKGSKLELKKMRASAAALAAALPPRIAKLAPASEPPPPIPASHVVYVDAGSGGVLLGGATPYSPADVAKIGQASTIVVNLLTAKDRQDHPVEKYTADTVQGCELWEMPIDDMKAPTPAALATLTSSISSAVTSGKTVYVHCRGGLGRAGLVCGAVLATLHPELSLLDVLALLSIGLAKRAERPRRKKVPYYMPQTKVQIDCLKATMAPIAAPSDAYVRSKRPREEDGGDPPPKRRTINIFG